MKPKTVPWDDATLHELKMFAAQSLGMMTTPNIGLATIRAKIRQAYSGDDITFLVRETDEQEGIGDAPVAVVGEGGEAPAVGKALRGHSAEGDPKVKITIAEVEGAGGSRPVYVGVNGVGMLIPRGRPVDIPYRYYRALKCAIKTVHEQDEATGDILSAEVPAYPFSVNKEPDKAEVAAYLAAEQKAA